jgi:hypothetical protein
MYKYKYKWATSERTAVRVSSWHEYTNPSRQVAHITYRGAQYL